MTTMEVEPRKKKRVGGSSPRIYKDRALTRAEIKTRYNQNKRLQALGMQQTLATRDATIAELQKENQRLRDALFRLMTKKGLP
jgi:hypothetical protein